jgi:hypothetical protein
MERSGCLAEFHVDAKKYKYKGLEQDNGSCIHLQICIIRLWNVVPPWADHLLMGRSSQDPSTSILVSASTGLILGLFLMEFWK